MRDMALQPNPIFSPDDRVASQIARVRTPVTCLICTHHYGIIKQMSRQKIIIVGA